MNEFDTNIYNEIQEENPHAIVWILIEQSFVSIGLSALKTSEILGKDVFVNTDGEIELTFPIGTMDTISVVADSNNELIIIDTTHGVTRD